MKKRIMIEWDEQGRSMSLVDVGHGKVAKVLEEDYRQLIAKGISPTWFMSGDGKGRYYVAAYHRGSKKTGGRVNVARLLLGLGSRETVAYRGRDRLDLRPENITRAKGYAKGNETYSVTRAAA